MNGTVKTILGLLTSGKPELQVAAAQILGELKPKEPAVVKALGDAIGRSPVLARFCLDALSKIRTGAALQIVAQAMLESEPVAEHAAQLLSEVGSGAHPVLGSIYDSASHEQKIRILTVLARHVDKEAVSVFVRAIVTPDVAEAAGRLLIAERAQFTPATQKQLRAGLEQQFGEALPDACIATALDVLAAVDRSGSRSIFLRFIEAGGSPLARAAAFRGLRGSKLTATQVRGMMMLLEDAAQKDVHEAVRDVLADLPELPSGMAPGLKRLLSSRQIEQRLFALRMLRNAGGAELARTCLKLLDHDDERLRKAASEALANNKQAIEPVLKLMLATRNPRLANACAQTLLRQAPNLTPKLVRAMAEKAIKLLASNPTMGDLLLDLTLQSGGAKMATFYVDRAVRLRRAKRFPEALHVLAKVASTPHGGDEAHYQIALTKIVSGGAVTAEEAAPGNSTMGFLTVLVRGGFPLFERMRRESCLKPEMLLSVGQHFANSVGAERRFGVDVLQHLAARTKGRAGEEAKVLLRSVSA
jgi:HEAT repeat protein